MDQSRSIPTAAAIPVLTYPDIRAAVAWLCEAFGFRERLRIGAGHRAQLRCGDGAVILSEPGGDRRAPLADGTSHSVMVRITGLDAHHRTAAAYGAKILEEPADFPFGERQYTVRDLAGHRWTFSETLRDVDPADWGGELIQ